MHLGLVIYASLDTVSGGYLYDRRLVEHLQRQGDTVEIISLPWRAYPQHLFDNLSPTLYRKMRDARFDVVLQDELNHPSLVLLNRRLRATTRFPILSIVHHLRASEAHPDGQAMFYRWIEKQYLASVDGFIFNSETTRRAVCQLLGRREFEKSIVAYPAGDRFRPSITDADLILRAHEPGALRLVFVGNLIPRKGLHTLLSALARLPSKMWQLTVVGNPHIDLAYTRGIRKTISELRLLNVELAGALPDAPLENLLAHSHVLVVPSQYEGFGIVYLEGMSFGLPAIATTAGGASEIIRDGENGFLVLPGDRGALGTCLDKLIGDRDLLARMSVAARQRFLDHPTWHDSMTRIRQKLKEMIQ